jgi:hypothetical protein
MTTSTGLGDNSEKRGEENVSFEHERPGAFVAARQKLSNEFRSSISHQSLVGKGK